MPTDEFREAAEIEATTPITVGATELQTICNEILEATGDNRGCVEPCGECGKHEGVGAVPQLDQYGDVLHWTRCPACNGHGTTWRKDAVGRERIASAINIWECILSNDAGEEWESYRNYILSCERQDKDWWQVTWDNRHGQPWQDAIERHVRDYREPAPDYAADWNAMGRLLGHLESCIEQIQVIAFNGAKHIEFRHFYHCILSELLEITKPSEWPQTVVKAVHAALCKGE